MALEEMLLGGGFDVSQAQVRSRDSLFLLPADSDVELPATFCTMSASMLPCFLPR